jgi:hypothetical protein
MTFLALMIGGVSLGALAVAAAGVYAEATRVPGQP